MVRYDWKLGVLGLLAVLVSFGLLGGLPGDALAQGRPQVIAVSGIGQVGGLPARVDILVEVQPGQTASQAAAIALASQGARPFSPAALGADGFTLTGLYWEGHTVSQRYNSDNAPFSAEAELRAAADTWTDVTTSDFSFVDGGTTLTCPSLVRECPGPQVFDGYNDVGWARLSRGTLGVTWSGTNSNGAPEADLVLSTAVGWSSGCQDSDYNAQTVLLHEIGHVLGLDHSKDSGAVMYAYYRGALCSLTPDDEEGITYLYDTSVSGVVSGVVEDGNNDPIAGATVTVEGTGLSTTTAADGSYSIGGLPDPVTYSVTASSSGNSDSQRVLVTGSTAGVDFTLTSSSGGGGGGSGGPPKCHPKFGC